MADRSPNDLRAFLRERRAQIRPESVGIVPHGHRRVRGLRRDEVAELAGISVAWYTRFETGRARLSIAALQRVAGVLLLARHERRRLLELARPDVAEIDARGLADTFSGLGAATEALRDLARACRSASSFAEHGELATRAVFRLVGGEALAYARAYDAAVEELSVVAVCGPRGDALAGHRMTCASVAYAMANFVDGRPYAEHDLRVSPCVELRTRVERVGVCAYHSQPIMNGRGLDAVLGFAPHEPVVPAAWQVAGLEAAAAVVELSLAR